METLKLILFNRFKTMFTVFLVTGISLFLLMIRLKLTQSFFLLFLVWNVFLAAIPFFVTFYLSSKKELKKYRLIGWGIIWLLFLPNAPYIVTDFIHLTHLKANMLILDTLLISFCSLSGLLFYLISLADMETLLKRFYPKKRVNIMIWGIPFLCGFGIYLGRFLRWNSWDIIQQPDTLFHDILSLIVNPLDHKLAWLVTFSFGVVLSSLYFLTKRKLTPLQDE